MESRKEFSTFIKLLARKEKIESWKEYHNKQKTFYTRYFGDRNFKVGHYIKYACGVREYFIPENY